MQNPRGWSRRADGGSTRQASVATAWAAEGCCCLLKALVCDLWLVPCGQCIDMAHAPPSIDVGMRTQTRHLLVNSACFITICCATCAAAAAAAATASPQRCPLFWVRREQGIVNPTLAVLLAWVLVSGQRHMAVYDGRVIGRLLLLASRSLLFRFILVAGLTRGWSVVLSRPLLCELRVASILGHHHCQE